MTEAAGLNWDMLKAGCVTRRNQCVAAIEHLRASAVGSSNELRIRGLETVVAGLETMISECEANPAKRYEAAADRPYTYRGRAEFAVPPT